MATTTEQGALFEQEEGGDGTVVVTERCRIQTCGGYRVVTVVRAAMWTPVPVAGGAETFAGLGILVAEDPDLGLVLNHTGGVDGFTSNLFLFPDLGVAFFSAQNNDATDPKIPFRAIAELVLP